MRSLEPDDLGGPVDVAVADLSFISLLTVAPALARCTTPDGDFVLLVKPQFEAGPRPRRQGRHRARSRRSTAPCSARCATACADAGLFVADVMASPLRGADGNVEFLVRCDARGPALDDARLDDVVDVRGMSADERPRAVGLVPHPNRDDRGRAGSRTHRAVPRRARHRRALSRRGDDVALDARHRPASTS